MGLDHCRVIIIRICLSKHVLCLAAFKNINRNIPLYNSGVTRVQVRLHKSYNLNVRHSVVTFAQLKESRAIFPFYPSAKKPKEKKYEGYTPPSLKVVRFIPIGLLFGKCSQIKRFYHLALFYS